MLCMSKTINYHLFFHMKLQLQYDIYVVEELIFNFTKRSLETLD